MAKARVAQPSRFRGLVMGLWLAAAVSTLVFRLVQLQLIGSGEFRERADGNRLRITLEPAPRGLILDRHGEILAANRQAYSVVLYPIKLTRAQTQAVIDRLGRLLALSPLQILARWKEARNLPVRILQDVDPKTIAIIAENQRLLPGVSIEPLTVRYYPRGRFAAHLLGYTGEITNAELQTMQDDGYRQGDIIGKSGLEKTFDSILRGQPGRLQVEVDARGRPIQTLAEIPPVPGKNITTTIDAELQAVAEQGLEGKVGAIVALDPQNGQVLTLASKPDFNPNVFAGRLTPQDWKALNSRLHPLLDRAISATYPPGSTFKVVTTVAAMQSDIVKEDTPFDSTGIFTLGGHIFHDWKKGGFGRVTFHDALVNSIDTVYYQLGVELGADRMAHYAHLMGLGQRTGILLDGESPGVIPDNAWAERHLHRDLYPGESAIMAIGQGYVLATPLQLAVMVSTVANGGRVVRPKLLLPPAPQEAKDPGIINHWSAATWHMLRTAMRDVIDRGTGTTVHIPGIQIAGKTGTAQWRGKKTNAMMVVFSPISHPRIAISCAIEHGGEGALGCGPILNRMLRQFYGLPLSPNATQSAKATLALEKPATGVVASVNPYIPARPGAAD